MGSLTRFSVCLLVLILVLSWFPVCVRSTGPEEILPGETFAEESFPEETLWEETLPEMTVPAETLAEETLPEVTVPEAAAPEEIPAEETVPPEEIPPELPLSAAPTEIPAGPGLYFGLLNGHTSISEGCAPPEALYHFAAQLPGMDFFGITDHSDSFDNAQTGSIDSDATVLSSDWAAGKAAAAAATTGSFTALFGFEMNWPGRMKVGHISSFGTPGFQSWDQPPYCEYDDALQNYYDTLALVPDSVSQFCHPGTQYGSFSNFSFHSPEADQAVSLLELDLSAKDPVRYYCSALDRGWHLAPTAAASIFSQSWQDTGIRTVVYAPSLTEDGILSALKECRAYATEDPDLEILYSMDGHFMGSRLDLRHTGDTADISVTFHDPTDSAIGQVEVITSGAEAVAIQSLTGSSGTLTFSFPTASGYYFLRVTQPDGDIAVTAPIWVDAEEELGISAFTCETEVPVRNEPIHLTLTVTNGESPDFLVDSLILLADGVPVLTDSSLAIVSGQSTVTHPLTLSCSCAGLTRLTAVLSGTLEGSPRCFEAALDLNFRQSGQVTSILVDGSHGNAGTDSLNILTAMALEESILLSVETGPISSRQLEDCRFLLVPAPTRPFSDEFLAAVMEFAGYGGSIILCGQARETDGELSGADELNRLLSAIGSGIRLGSDTLLDPVSNGGHSTLFHSGLIDRTDLWCRGISRDQVYRAASCCTVIPGSGKSLVTGRSTTVSSEGGETEGITLLACETLSGGGTVFAAGSLFLSDDCLAEPDNLWDAPYANRILAGNFLEIGGEILPLSTIRDVRQSFRGDLFRIRGYITAGTSNPYNSFPDTLYLQDETGGIAVTPFSGTKIQEGTPMEVTGYAGIQNGNRILKVSSWKVLQQPPYQYQAMTGPWDTLLDTVENGSRLVAVEGTCREIYCREDNSFAGCLLEDGNGNTALIRIEDHIENSSGTENKLHKTIRKNRTVRASGLLHRDEYGETVIRVRNCEEVAWVPPRDYVNPKTGDLCHVLPIVLSAASLAGLCLLRKFRRI